MRVQCDALNSHTFLAVMSCKWQKHVCIHSSYTRLTSSSQQMCLIRRHCQKPLYRPSFQTSVDDSKGRHIPLNRVASTICRSQAQSLASLLITYPPTTSAYRQYHITQIYAYSARICTIVQHAHRHRQQLQARTQRRMLHVSGMCQLMFFISCTRPLLQSTQAAASFSVKGRSWSS